MVKTRHLRTETDTSMTSLTPLLAQSDWTLSVNWCSVIVQFGLLKLLAFVVLAIPILLVAWMFFRMRAMELAVEGGAASQSRLDPELGFVYEAPPADRDDLQRITGVGAILEGKLHECGVYKFRQIAGWSDGVAAEFGKRLAFGDRIFRDGWREQAARLQAEKHGGSE